MSASLHRAQPGALHRLAQFLQVVTLLVACAALLLLLWIAARRDGYPFDLEWMEGSMLCHALRLLNGQPIYGPPSVDFIPHLYTPLYPAVVAALGAVTGDVTYVGGRLISLLSFLLSLLYGGWLCLRAAPAADDGAAAPWPLRPGVLGLCALALPVLGFNVVGGWYDLCRSDSLQLFLSVLGLGVCWRYRDSHRAMVGGAVLLCLSFFAKQTAAPLIALGGVAIFVSRPRQGLTLLVAGVVTFALGVLWLNHWSSGWFWTYIFRLHQQHAFDRTRALDLTPRVLGRALGPALLLVPWALWQHGRTARGAGLRYLTWLGLAGALTACVAAGTQWSHVNAYIPGLFFPALAVGAAASLLSGGAAWQRVAVAALLLGSLVPRFYRPEPHLPAPGAVQAGAEVLSRLRRAPGEVLIPFHPFYAHLAGKRTYLHRMGVWDVRGTAAGPVRGLSESLREQRFAAIVFDAKVEQTWHDWPDVLRYYRVAERFAGPRTVEGADTVPALLLVPVPDAARGAGSGASPSSSIDLEVQ